MTPLTDRQRRIIDDLGIKADVADLVRRIEQSSLTSTEIEIVISALSDAFHMQGMDETLSPTPDGIEIEALLDIVNRPRLRLSGSDKTGLPAAKPIEDVRRGGWLGMCPGGHRLRATILKSWDCAWRVRYDSAGMFITIGKLYPADHNAADTAALLAQHGRVLEVTVVLDTRPHCPVCGIAIPFEDGDHATTALWIEGQILVDERLARVTRLGAVDT